MNQIFVMLLLILIDGKVLNFSINFNNSLA